MENVPGMRNKIKEIEKDIETYTGADYKYEKGIEKLGSLSKIFWC